MVAYNNSESVWVKDELYNVDGNLSRQALAQYLSICAFTEM